MPVVLEGGCLVAAPGETAPLHGEAISLGVQMHAGGLLEQLEHDQMLYVLAGEGRVDGHAVGPDTGIYLPAGTAALCEGQLSLACARTPAERRAGASLQVVRLADCPAHATGDRFYRELIHARVTQFVGHIPPGRAP